MSATRRSDIARTGSADGLCRQPQAPGPRDAHPPLSVAPRRGPREDQPGRHHLWRAVNHECEVLESSASKRRDRNAALKFLPKLLHRYGQLTSDGPRQAVIRDGANSIALVGLLQPYLAENSLLSRHPELMGRPGHCTDAFLRAVGPGMGGAHCSRRLWHAPRTSGLGRCRSRSRDRRSGR